MKYGLCVLAMLGIFAVPFFSVNAASWVSSGGDLTASGDVFQNTGFTGSGYDSITVGMGNSANFNDSGLDVDNLGFEVSNDITIAGDLWHNNGDVAAGGGGFGVRGDNTHINAVTLNIGGDFVMGNGSNSYTLTLNINDINAASLTTNAGSKLVLNPDYASGPAFDIAGGAVIADGIYMGNDAIGAESVHIRAAGSNDTYTLDAHDFETDGFINVAAGKLIINSDTDIDVTGNVSGNLFLNAADAITIGGDLGRGVTMAAHRVHIGNNVLGGVRIAANPVGADGIHTSFDRVTLDVGGTYYFDNDSFLQLVLNQDVANSDADPVYDADLDDALIHVGGFDAGGVTRAPNMDDMTSSPNIEILVDNIMQELRRIKLLESDTVITDLGALDLAGIWFYDATHQTRLFQEAGLSLAPDGRTVYLNIATMRSIAGMVALVPKYAGPTVNDMNMACAIDDVILARLGTGKIDGYSSIMRLLFPEGDAHHNMMVNGGVYDDALDVMISDGAGFETDQTYIRAMNYVRQFAMADIDTITRTMSVSGRLIRGGVSDHLLDDFIWQRYHNKGVGWAALAITSPDGGGSVFSFVGGVDWRFDTSWTGGVTLGYNHINFNSTNGYTLNLGGYALYEVAPMARLYGTANLSFNSLDIETHSPLTGRLAGGMSSTDATMELGMLHRLFNTYLTGRAYASFGYLGGYSLDKKSQSGQGVMDIKYDGSFVFIPGYEVALGKDIYLGLWAFVRPSLKFAVEYDVLQRDPDFQFKFSEGGVFRTWDGTGLDGRLWLRYGIQAEFAISQGANLKLGYDIIKNGDFSAASFKLSGSIRF